jgi:hypothetical protein
VDGRSSARWDVLAQQPVGVLVAAPQSAAGRRSEEHPVGDVDGDLIVLGHFGALVPGQHAPRGWRQAGQDRFDGVYEVLGAAPHW